MVIEPGGRYEASTMSSGSVGMIRKMSVISDSVRSVRPPT